MEAQARQVCCARVWAAPFPFSWEIPGCHWRWSCVLTDRRQGPLLALDTPPWVGQGRGGSWQPGRQLAVFLG